MSQFLTTIITRANEFHYNRPILSPEKQLDFIDNMDGLVMLMARNRRLNTVQEGHGFELPTSTSNYPLTDFITKVIQLYENAPNMTPQNTLNAVNSIHSSLFDLVRNKPQTVPISQESFEIKNDDEPCPTECFVCQEIPNYSSAIRTDCGHFHCKECWNHWSKISSGRPTCTACRKYNPLITGFKIKGKVLDDEIEWDKLYACL